MKTLFINRVELIGQSSDIESLYKKYTTIIPESIMTIDGEQVFENGIEVGFYNPKYKVFLRDGHENIIGIPEGYTAKMEQEDYFFPDFNKIVPLYNHQENDGLKLLANAFKVFQKHRKMKLAKWGVPDNSASFERISNTIFQFQTQNSPSYKIIDAISKDFPELVIIFEVVDQNFEHTFEKMIYKNGEIIAEVKYEFLTKEANELILRLLPSSYKFLDTETGIFTCKKGKRYRQKTA